MINGEIQIPKEGNIGAYLTKLNNLDLTFHKLYNLMYNDSQENQLMAHFASGQRALHCRSKVLEIK